MTTTMSRESTDVARAAALRGELRLPGDKSISHRALMLALLAEGETRITGAGDGADVRSTAGIVAALGAGVTREPGDAGTVDYVVASPGASGISGSGHLDCGNSGTSMRLFAGMLAGLPMRVTLDGDVSLRSRPMARVIEPLGAMGATLDGSGADETRPPLSIQGRTPLQPIDWTTTVPSAQVKSAILLAGLAARGTTTVRESVATRDHTERMLRARGVDVCSTSTPGGGATVAIDGPATVAPLDQVVPGDPSAAAFWLVAAAIHPDAELRLAGVGINASRRAVIDLLRRMGANIEEDGKPHGAGAPADGTERDDGTGERDAAGERDATGQPDDGVGEPIADLVVRSSELEAIEVSAAETAAAIDEIPVLCLAATQARGRTVIRGAGELRHKESDRIAGILAGLRALGARIDAAGDDIAIEGPTGLRGTVVDSLGDHRLALTFAIAGLVAEGATTILDADCVAISYPRFFTDLERIQS